MVSSTELSGKTSPKKKKEKKEGGEEEMNYELSHDKDGGVVGGLGGGRGREGERERLGMLIQLDKELSKGEGEGERERGRLTFARPVGKGAIILNPIGRLSNLYLFIWEGVPPSANGRTDCFKTVGSSSTIAEFVFELWGTTFSADLFLSIVISVCGDPTAIPGSVHLGVAAFAASPTIPTLGLFAACSAPTSPLSPVACKQAKLENSSHKEMIFSIAV